MRTSFLLGAAMAGCAVAALFVGGLTAQTWFPYTPPSPCVPNIQCPYPGMSPEIAQGVDAGGNPYLEARLVFSGDAVVAGASAWIDLDPAIVPAGELGPRMYAEIWQPDAQLFAGPSMSLWPMSSIVPAAVAPASGIVAPESTAPPWAAWTVDVQGQGLAVVRVAFARLTYAPSLAPGVTVILQLHTVCNMLHERDGSGWSLSYWTGVATL